MTLSSYQPLTLVLAVSTLISAALAHGSDQVTTLILALLTAFALFQEGERNKELTALRDQLQKVDLEKAGQINELRALIESKVAEQRVRIDGLTLSRVLR